VEARGVYNKHPKMGGGGPPPGPHGGGGFGNAMGFKLAPPGEKVSTSYQIFGGGFWWGVPPRTGTKFFNGRNVKTNWGEDAPKKMVFFCVPPLIVITQEQKARQRFKTPPPRAFFLFFFIFGGFFPPFA